MSGEVEFPAMRQDVEDALAAFANPELQARWGKYDVTSNSYDDLTLNVNILFDCQVFPDPGDAVDAAIATSEAPALATLFLKFKPMLEELGDAPDHVYTSDPRWAAVVEAAAAALLAMKRRDEGTAR